MTIFKDSSDGVIPVAETLTPLEASFCGVVAAGFPAEAFNYMEDGIDFNKLLARQKETTFCLIAGGDSQSGDGINRGDLLVIDRLAEPCDNSILVLSVDGAFTLKRLRKRNGYVELVASNPAFKPLKVRDGEELKRWGVLKFVIKKF